MNLHAPQLRLLDDVVKTLKRGTAARAEVVGPWGTGKTLVAAQAAEALGVPLLVIASGRIESEAIHDDLETFFGEDHSALFPAWEVLPTDSMSPADDIVAERMNTLKRLALALEKKEALHTVVPIRSLLQFVAGTKRLLGDTLSLQQGEEYDLEDLLEGLIKLGYTREVMVENRGDVSVRGGIVDIFPISSELPYRVEFFGDEVDSIRRFEPETQRSVDETDRIDILPRSEKGLLATQSKHNALAALTTYFPKNTLVVLDEPLAIAEEAERITDQYSDSIYYMDWPAAKATLERFPQLSLAQVAFEKAKDVPRFTMPMRSVSNWAGHIDDFWAQLKDWEARDYRVRLVCLNTGERRRLTELLEEQGFRLGQGAFDLTLTLGRLRAGFSDEMNKLAIISEREMFGRHYIRRKRRRFEAGAAITQFSDLKTGDFVVHNTHGIGRYMGLKRFEGKAGDFIGIQYAAGDTIYVPVTHIDQVQKYIGGEGAMPRMDRIGGASWTRKKTKVKKAVREMTEALIQLYAQREYSRGHAFTPDTPWQTEFEDAFEYDETPDQLRAIKDLKIDMETKRPMDRLLCGDVGYGKTEVALRAAFKAVNDNKQVVILAPTTVLAQQHYQTFSERMADFPVKIEIFSRFRSPKQIRESVDALKTGEADIAIGTHRLLSKDIDFHDLGLVIVDEEQRFGVAHKERLKQLKAHVDVLTMTATPIPRTLHFSLIGVRDMSLINTAPNDRLPIHTCIEPWDDTVIQEAIRRELGREGQVFFLHNRVHNIERIAAHVNKLVPEAKVAIGHGQMHKHELEEVMTAFISKQVDVLVCTTIIGSGIDIPNANTIIINRADMFGLSELYQIRGRVGRYKHRAFAYLLIPGDKALSEEAQQRLKALEDFSALGSGFRIAMRDLEIRGAGDLLGADQSGHITTVGYETYKDLIAEAVSEIKGEAPKRRDLPSFDMSIDAYIPEDFVPTAQQKMTLYRRIAAVQSLEEVQEITREINDRFGSPPRPVRRLLSVMGVRARAADFTIKSITSTRDAVRVEFTTARFLSARNQGRLQQALGNAITFSFAAVPALRYTLENNKDPLAETERLLTVLGEL